MPVIVSKINNNRNQHGEGLIFVGLKNIQEVVVFKEAHSSISYLEMDATNAPNDSLKEFGNQMLNLVNLTDLKHLLQFCQEKSLFDAVGERPVLKETLKKGNSEGSVLSQEKH